MVSKVVTVAISSRACFSCLVSGMAKLVVSDGPCTSVKKYLSPYLWKISLPCPTFFSSPGLVM